MQFNSIGFVGGELVSSLDVELVGFRLLSASHMKSLCH
jgi:hypothetical protein